MNSRLLDPNNHAPAVMPDDGWDDLEGFTELPQVAITVLPPRRLPTARAGTDKPEAALRIEPTLAPLKIDDTPQRLEVREFDGGVVRLEQPLVEKIERVQLPFKERPARNPDSQHIHGEDRKWGHVQRRPLRWMIGGGAGVAAAVIFSLAMLPAINAPNQGLAQPLGPIPNAPDSKIEGMAEMDAMLARQDDARRIYARYATAVVADDVGQLVLNGAALREKLRENWRRQPVPAGWEPSADSGWSAYMVGGRACGVLTGALPDGSEFAAWFVTAEDGSLALDWEATAGYGTAPFEKLAVGAGDGSRIRGTMSAVDFYTAAWPEETYRSFRFVSPDGGTLLWCYTRRGTSEEAGISSPLVPGSIVRQAENSRRMTVSLARGPDGSLPNQWLVTEMLHLDWVAP